MTVHEESAGFVVYRMATPEEGQPARRLYLLLDYGRHWDYPKGHLEKGETPMDAAVRELKEETGIGDPQVIPGFAREIVYYFREKKKGLVRKKVTFYLAQIETEKVKLSDEHEGYAFEPYDSALAKLTFATARQVLRQAEEFLAARVE